MSLAFSKNLARYLEQLVVGPPIFDRRGKVANMVVYPIFPSRLQPDPPDMITLSEALLRGARLSDTGIVSRVHLDNPLPTSVLAGESEILMGPTQQRSVQFSCLIAPKRRAALPVNCVEEGQPTRYQAEFTRADACPWPVRSFKMEQLARHGEPPQYWVWDNIKSYLESTDTASKTGDVHAVFDQNSFKMQSSSPAFPCRPGQVGAICAVGQNLFIELFGDPEILEDRYEQVLRSALVEAVARPSDQVVPPDKVRAFLTQLIEASQRSKVLESRSLKESGRALAFSNLGISGSALIADGRLVHLSAHQKCLGQSRSFTALRPDLEAASAAWEEEKPPFLDEVEKDYASRRRRYNAFKARLTAPTNGGSRPQEAPLLPAEAPTAAARPEPLNSALHDFFLHLFRKS